MLKVVIEFVTTLLLLYILLFCLGGAEDLSSQPGISPTPPAMEGEVLTLDGRGHPKKCLFFNKSDARESLEGICLIKITKLTASYMANCLSLLLEQENSLKNNPLLSPTFLPSPPPPFSTPFDSRAPHKADACDLHFLSLLI